jgi:hypothetical protein
MTDTKTFVAILWDWIRVIAILAVAWEVAFLLVGLWW